MPKKKVKKARTKKALEEGLTDKHGVPIPGKAKPRQKISAEEREYMLERELRRYVKRSGGFRKNLPKEYKEVALRIMKKLERKKPEWDVSINIFGVDKPTVARLNVDAS